MWATFWSLTDFDLEAQLLHQQQRLAQSKAREQVRQVRAELNWDNELSMGYGAEEFAVVVHQDTGPVVRAQSIDTIGGWEQVKETTVAWGQVLRATWLLMTQPGVTDVEEHHLPRTLRRRAERDGYNPAGVRVVRIRHRENTPSRDERSARQYRVRWTVRGHWRNQWFPKRGEHRPVWINPHIKGPEGAPMHTGQTVHILDQ